MCWSGPFPISWQVWLLGLVWMFLSSRSNAGGNGLAGFPGARPSPGPGPGKKVTFDDVAGADEEKEELQEIVEFLRDPRALHRSGGPDPQGRTAGGPAGHRQDPDPRLWPARRAWTSCPSRALTSWSSTWAWAPPAVRDLFDQAKKEAPAIVFIDEIDAVGRQRGTGLGGGHDEREQTLNQLLVEMDGFASNRGGHGPGRHQPPGYPGPRPAARTSQQALPRISVTSPRWPGTWWPNTA